MNVIFRIIQIQYSMHLQFKLVFSEKKSTKWNKLMKYRKNQSKCAKFEYVVPGTVVGLPKKIGGQNQKINK